MATDSMRATQALVIGAGPYALSAAALARERGIETVVLGRSMGFWREHMPERMFLRSGPDWHLDATGIHTLEAFLEERGIAPDEVDPIPIGLFLDYAEWFRRAKNIEVEEDLVAGLARTGGRFEATLDSGARITADAVIAAPGIRHFANVPEWAGSLPSGCAAHSCDLVRLGELAGARVLIVGGRQSAYEWAALAGEQGAERVDVVHRHEVPRFERVSWRFVDPYVEDTVRIRGWWRRLPAAEQEAIGRRFWEVGRLTLEHWLTPRLAGIHRWPGAEVAETTVLAEGAMRMRLSSGERLMVDRVIFASGYKADLARVPYLAGVIGRIEVTDGFPVLDEAMGTSLDGLYLPGFAATRDFGPFFGFVKAAPAAATLIVNDLLARA
jgi:cation diffusion facilitator CzcD-associated flavoprotein CzcO